MADNHDTLIREVKAELERERYENLWKKYGTYFLAAGVALVAGVGGFQYWQASKSAHQQKVGAAYDAALSLAAEKKYDEAAAEFARIAAETGGGYKVLSQLQLAATYLDQKRTDEAIEAFDRAANSGGDPVFTDFARLQAAALRLGTADFTEIENRLNGLISDQNPWRFNARELLALAQLRSGQTEKARETLNGLIVAQGVPQDMRDRVQVLLSEIVAADIAKEAAKAVKPSGTPAEDGGTAPGPAAQGSEARDNAAPGTTDEAKTEPQAGGGTPAEAREDGAAGSNEAAGTDKADGGGDGKAPSAAAGN